MIKKLFIILCFLILEGCATTITLESGEEARFTETYISPYGTLPLIRVYKDKVTNQEFVLFTVGNSTSACRLNDKE